MSLYGMMRTGASGMNAQANRLSTVADNIANASTTGYKTASTEFSSLLLPSTSGNYNSGAVQSVVRNAISQQGALTYTSSDTDLAINGNGFFVVQDSNGQKFLTRAGSFVPNDSGQLVNASGYTLLGYQYTTEAPTPVVNGFDGLEPVTVGGRSLTANASTEGSFSANLDSRADLAANITDAPTDPAGNAYNYKSSIKVYDSLGNEQLLNIYYTKMQDADPTVPLTGDPDADAASTAQWQVQIFKDGDTTPLSLDSADDTAMTLEFDSDGQLYGSSLDGTFVGSDDPAFGKVTISGDSTLSGYLPNIDTLSLDLSGMTQLAYAFSPQDAHVDGNAPSQVDKVQIDSDGTVYAQYENGDLLPIYRIAMANVESPDNLNVVSGNIYSPSADSGVVILGFAGSGGFGSITSGALESSNVDLANELTSMIESQRTYTANSKVFQTGGDLLDVLVNLKR